MARIRPVTSLRAGSASVAGSVYAEHTGSGALVSASSTLAGTGNVSSQNPEPSATDNAQADWESRISGAGVVWYHDFKNAAEVNNFRWSLGHGSGNDPNDVARPGVVAHTSEEGITGGCMVQTRFSASSDGTHWIRPLSALTSPGNGRDKPDPAAFGTLPVRSYNPTNGGGQISSFAYGRYGHSSYHADGSWEGDEFWIQLRQKRDPRRVQSPNHNVLVGKLNWLTTLPDSLTQQELVTYSNGGGGAGHNRFRIYGINGSDPLDTQEDGDGTVQPGGVATVWEWSLDDTWDTVLYHIKMGRDNVLEGHLDVYVAREGESQYTHIWDQDLRFKFNTTVRGYSCLMLSTYNNGSTSLGEFNEKWAQIIFSKEYIPCPQPSFPSWYPEEPGTIVELSSGTTIGSAARADGANSFPGTDPDNITAPWSGGAIVYIQGRPYLVVYGGGHGDSAYNGILKFGPLYGEGSDNPQWSVFLPASSTSAVRNASTYADGRQAANHTYNNLEGVFDRLYNLATDAHYSDGSKTDQAFAFTPDGQIDIADHSRAGARGCAAFDPNTRRIYYAFGAGQFQDLQYYDINGDSWGTVSGDDFYFNTYVMGACDTKRGALLFAGENTSGGAQVYYWPNVTSGTKRTGFALPANHGWSIIYDPWRDAFVSMVNGSRTVRELDAAALAAGQTPSWTDRTFSGATPATGHSAGTWGRFRAVPELRGYILVPTSESAVYFYRSV